ncbi:MAG: hypothetical protein R2820_12155 [Cyclobacteriaceae bacterium]|nr:hypothetical protein [Cyclobacteriaceae bacterium]
MKNVTIATITLAICSHLAIAQTLSQDEIKNRISQIVNFESAKTILTSGGLMLSGDFIVEGDRIIGMQLVKYPSGYEKKPFAPPIAKAIYYGDELSGLVQEVGCSNYRMEWNDHDFVLDEQGRVIQATAKGYYKMSGYKTDEFKIEYGPDNRIAKALLFMVNFKGKSTSDLTLDFKAKVYEVQFTWESSGSTVQVRRIHYRKKEKAKEPDVEDMVNSLTFTIKDGYVSTIKAIDQKGSVLQDHETMVTPDSVVVVMRKGQRVSETQSFRFESPTVAIITNHQFDNAGALSKFKRTKVTYTVSDGQTDTCKAKSKPFTQEFDANGVLVLEQTDTHVRLKNPDGTWGDWKQLQY